MLITFVCVGNTCRSPLLKHLFERYAREQGFQCEVRSAGLRVTDGKMSIGTKNVLLEHGISVENQDTTILDEQLIKDSNLIVAVEKRIADYISNMGCGNKVYSLSSPLLNGVDMLDPYGAGQDEYERIYRQGLDALPKILSLAKMLK